MWEVFNNREIATIVWGIVILPFLLRPVRVRKSLAGLLKMMFAGKLLFPVLLLAAYIGGIVYLLSRLELWTVTLLKDTLFWFFSAGLLTIYKYVSAKDGNVPIKELLFDNLKLIVVLEFLTNTYTFALWAEVILVPVVMVVAMMNAYAEATKENRDVAKLLGGIMAGIGILMVGHTLYSAVQDYRALGTFETLRSFLLPILLSAAIIPTAYLMAVFASYESLFVGFKLGKDRSKRFVNYCKWRVLWHCGFSIKRISRLKPFNLMHLESKEDLNSMLRESDRRDVRLTPSEE
jgi:hypothetical protein